jgi:hypothetical protein
VVPFIRVNQLPKQQLVVAFNQHGIIETSLHDQKVDE